MVYKKIKPYNHDEQHFRKLWAEVYCEQQIYTFDNIEVKFYANMFDHCFYESADRKKKDKSILSYNRLEKILWIKDALEDPDAIIKQGWVNKEKRYDSKRRVTIVKGNYIVVILVYSVKKARFITAYEVNDEKNLELIKNSPNWG